MSLLRAASARRAGQLASVAGGGHLHDIDDREEEVLPGRHVALAMDFRRAISSSQKPDRTRLVRAASGADLIQDRTFVAGHREGPLPPEVCLSCEGLTFDHFAGFDHQRGEASGRLGAGRGRDGKTEEPDSEEGGHPVRHGSDRPSQAGRTPSDFLPVKASATGGSCSARRTARGRGLHEFR